MGKTCLPTWVPTSQRFSPKGDSPWVALGTRNSDYNLQSAIPSSMRRDAIFYQVFQRFPALLFELVENPPPDASRYRFEFVEVKEPNFRIDGVFLPPDNVVSKTVFFAEVQFQKDNELYHRFIAESMLYLYRNSPVYSDWAGVVIFPSRNL